MISTAFVGEELARLRERIESAGGKAVRIVAVTKTFGADAIAAAVACGLTDIGENYAQELRSKADAINIVTPRPTVHFIGHLQTNKVTSIASLVDRFDTVDRESLIAEIARRAPGARILVQVNVSAEESKFGCEPRQTDALVDRARAAGLTVDGLMTIGRTGDPNEAREGFRLLRMLADANGVSTLSMGMSGDLDVAVEEGATEVRIGSALFGQRVPR